MSSQSGQPLPPVPASPPSPASVRRVHTISASSRTARANARDAISEETQEQQLWHDDEIVDQDWISSVGPVGENSSLHRQRSLPTRYHRVAGFHGQATHSGSVTPKTKNSLTAIAGHEGDEEDWERDMRGLRDEDVYINVRPEQPQHQQVMDAQSSGHSPLSPHFNSASHGPLPAQTLTGPGMQRHRSLNDRSSKPNQSELRRRGTLQESKSSVSVPPVEPSPSPPNEEAFTQEDDDYSYYARSPAPQQQQHSQGQYPSSTMGRSSPWNQASEWTTTSGSTTMDDVQIALRTLEISSTNPMYTPKNANFPAASSTHPPRFTLGQPSPGQAPAVRSTNNGHGNGNTSGSNSSRKLPPIPDFDGRKTPLAPVSPAGTSAYAPVGHSVSQQHPQQHQSQHHRSLTERDDRVVANSGAGYRDQKDRVLGARTSNPNLQYAYEQQAKSASIPDVPPIPAQYLSQQQQQQQVGAPRLGVVGFGQGQAAGGSSQQPQGYLNSSIDVPSLIAAKGYNPANFDIRPQFARFFVIKSYTEDDVHKSLKYEIWSSTDPGNKRLDKAFKETAGRGSIYLFFSVNASGHFCGMAEMLTPVDYTRSSTVWASDKWKGVFKVRWIFVRDIPNVNLRHIKLNNTQERKPVTNSRDTQELLPDAGQEMLRIFHTHPARTSLLQDFAFYELQAMQKMQVQGGQSSPTHSPNLSAHSPQPQSLPPTTQHQPNPFNMISMGNPNPLAYQMPQMTPIMQMQMQMNMGMGASQFTIPQSQAMHESVMRHSSPSPPGPLPVNGQGFMGMPGF